MNDKGKMRLRVFAIWIMTSILHRGWNPLRSIGDSLHSSCCFRFWTDWKIRIQYFNLPSLTSFKFWLLCLTDLLYSWLLHLDYWLLCPDSWFLHLSYVLSLGCYVLTLGSYVSALTSLIRSKIPSQKPLQDKEQNKHYKYPLIVNDWLGRSCAV